MYYIIETQEQLEKFSKYNLQNSFVHAITNNDKTHPALTYVVAYYIKPLQSRLGFILPITHSETFSLDSDAVISLFSNRIENAWVYDEKQAKYHLPQFKAVKSLKTAQWLKDSKVLDINRYNTPIHNHLYAKHGDRQDINRIIPISKLCEKYDNFVLDNTKLINSKVYAEEYYDFYSAIAEVYYKLESYGIPINKKVLQKYYTLDNPDYSIKDGYFYSEYNLYTQTGRPSNTFNGVNFGALPKGDDSRSFIEAKSTKLIEFDYKSYHPNILANMVGYHFDSDDIHTHLGKLYFETEHLTEEQYKDSKSLTFSYLYNSARDEVDLEYFKKVSKLRQDLWIAYKKDGQILTELSGRPIKHIDSATQILPYILQSYETERNAVIMARVLNYLQDKLTSLVLYNYDSFLLDWHKDDGEEVLTKVQQIIEKGGYKTSCSYGKNYSKMQKLTH